MTPGKTWHNNGFRSSTPHDHVFRNHSVGNNRSRADSGPRLWAVILRRALEITILCSPKVTRHHTSHPHRHMDVFPRLRRGMMLSGHCAESRRSDGPPNAHVSRTWQSRKMVPQELENSARHGAVAFGRHTHLIALWFLGVVYNEKLG
jgi:hypothetical protein